jgi:hypothetical protein
LGRFAARLGGPFAPEHFARTNSDRVFDHAGYHLCGDPGFDARSSDQLRRH